MTCQTSIYTDRISGPLASNAGGMTVHALSIVVEFRVGTLVHTVFVIQNISTRMTTIWTGAVTTLFTLFVTNSTSYVVHFVQPI